MVKSGEGGLSLRKSERQPNAARWEEDRLSKMEAKRWNERLKLATTALNATAVGTFGLGAIAPIISKLTTASSQAAADGMAALADLSFVEDVVWPPVIAAALLHGFAHILVSLMEPED